jgi:hypothetical protein
MRRKHFTQSQASTPKTPKRPKLYERINAVIEQMCRSREFLEVTLAGSQAFCLFERLQGSRCAA